MRLAWIPVIALAWTLGCGGDDSAPPAPEPPAPPPVAPQPPAPPAPPTDGGDVPSGNLRGDAAAGKVVYGQFCAVCHGAGGKGDGPTSASLNPKPADHTDHVYMAALSDEHLYKVIAKGGASIGKSPLMAAWGGVLTEAQIRDLIGFLRKLSNS